jgi:hypothetical protein
MLETLEGSSMGLVVFAGEARLVSPLSTDREGLASMIESVRPDDAGRPGSDIAAGLALAARFIHRPGDRPRAVVLVSDGESLSGDPPAGAAEVRRAGGAALRPRRGGGRPARRSRSSIPRAPCSESGAIRRGSPCARSWTRRSCASWRGAGKALRARGRKRASGGSHRRRDPLPGKHRGARPEHPRVRRALSVVRGRGGDSSSRRACRAAKEAG